MVRLVFRPYTQLRRSICTSESLRSSIRVSPDFNLARHSSPSFGSLRMCSCYSSGTRSMRSADIAPTRGSCLSPKTFAFTAPLGLVNPMTRTFVTLLGPCFKTGRRFHRPTRVRDGSRSSMKLDIRAPLTTRRARSQRSGAQGKPRTSPRGSVQAQRFDT